MTKITCDICKEVHEFEDNGTVDSLPDGYLVNGYWICDSCGSCPICGKSLEDEPDKRGIKAKACRDCEKAKRKIRLSHKEVNLIFSTPTKECWICALFSKKIRKDSEGCYIQNSVLSDDGLREHMRQLLDREP